MLPPSYMEGPVHNRHSEALFLQVLLGSAEY